MPTISRLRNPGWNRHRYQETENLIQTDAYIGLARASCWEEKGSNDATPESSGCSIEKPPPRMPSHKSRRPHCFRGKLPQLL